MLCALLIQTPVKLNRSA